MDKLIASFEKYSIYLLSQNGLLALSKFVINENYERHKINNKRSNDYYAEIMNIYNEEYQMFSKSIIFVAKNNRNEIIGSIRLFKWNGEYDLPIIKMFGINNLNEISPENSNEHIWHIGRFAIDSNIGKSAVILLIRLMMYAVLPIYKNKKGIMFAECDKKLFRTVNLMGIKATALSDGMEYLGSTTFPMYTIRDGLEEFISKNKELAISVNKIYDSLIYKHI